MLRATSIVVTDDFPASTRINDRTRGTDIAEWSHPPNQDQLKL
ncbi:hypothetical protein ACQPZU_11680 [Saccharomonospora azurea]